MAKKTAAKTRRAAPKASRSRSRKPAAEIKPPQLAAPSTPAPLPAPTPASRAAAARSGPVKVAATMLGYYDDIRRREGDVFMIRSMKDFSSKWMMLVDARTPEKITTGVEELRKKHDELLRERMPGGRAPMLTDAEPDAAKNPLGA